jgi:hypothetical protein
MPDKKFIDLLRGNSSVSDGKVDIFSAQDFIDSGLEVNKIPTGTGLMNGKLPRTPFSYNIPQGARQIQNGGSYIVLGQVPHSTKATGYGAKGLPADTIDLVVGRHSSTYGGKGPKKESVVENNFATDAARIYISRLCDIDQAFGLESQPTQNEGRGLIARSGIGLKADGVRIIGREGVKITTGRMKDARFGPGGETNSLGGKISEVSPRIELIAGNNYRKTQGVCLGKSTRNCLSELHDIIGEMWSAIFTLALTQAGYNAVNGVDFLRPWVPSIASSTLQQQFSRVIGPLFHTRVNAEFWKLNYLQPTSNDYIISRNVFTN